MKKKSLNKKIRNFELKNFVITILTCLFITSSILVCTGNCFGEEKYSPIVEKLYELYKKEPRILDKALANAVTPPTGVCSKSPVTGEPFCWKGKSIKDMLVFFERWLNFIPTPQNDGFAYYQLFYDFCYNNLYALQFVETEPWLGWTKNFTKARGEKMDSPVDPKIIDQWKAFLGEEWNDYIIPEGGFKTFNQFFTRKIKPTARPIFGDDTILAAPADSLINAINSNLTATTQINTKYEESLNIRQLLDGSKYTDTFNGGTAISCVLLPTVYHWYHAPVGGTVIESREIPGTSFGMNGGFYTFVNNGNFGGYKASFGVFGIYHRGYYIIETEKYGLVAMIPVGLDDVNSVNFVPDVSNIPENNPVKKITKGAPLGYFAYGGSVVILLFEPRVFTGLKVNQGQQVGIITPINR
ncbi:MAG: phosphatidylserine decarboxylase [Thermodesulfobacteriota bacterium]|nr:phosphatidylserine decarboxylase [Thermodesulfobacteriota bacterium]